jgi:hypothetical protein
MFVQASLLLRWSTVGIVTRLQPGQLKKCSFIPCKDKTFVSPPKCPVLLQDLASLLFSGYWGTLLEVKWPCHLADHSPPSIISTPHHMPSWCAQDNVTFVVHYQQPVSVIFWQFNDLYNYICSCSAWLWMTIGMVIHISLVLWYFSSPNIIHIYNVSANKIKLHNISKEQYICGTTFCMQFKGPYLPHYCDRAQHWCCRSELYIDWWILSLKILLYGVC